MGLWQELEGNFVYKTSLIRRDALHASPLACKYEIIVYYFISPNVIFGFA